LPTTSSSAGRCYRIGPFHELARAEQAGTTLTTLRLTFERRGEEQKTVSGYRVFLPSFPSKVAAARKRRELTRLGFRDHALIQGPAGRYAISLGVYSVERNAQNHLRRLAAKGVRARLEQLTQTQTIYWLELRHLPGNTAGGAVSLETLKQQDWGVKPIQFIESTCGSLRVPVRATQAIDSGGKAP